MATGWTDAGLAAVTSALGTTFYIALGTDTTPVAYARTQTALTTETSASGLARAAATVTRTTTTVSNDTLQGTKTFTAAATATITEVGWFDAAASGNMYSRSVLSSSRALVSGDTLAITYKLIFAI